MLFCSAAEMSDTILRTKLNRERDGQRPGKNRQTNCRVMLKTTPQVKGTKIHLKIKLKTLSNVFVPRGCNATNEIQ